MASLMETFEQQYATLSAEITAKIQHLSNFRGGERKMLVTQVERHLEEAHELLEQMELEVKGVSPALRQKFQILLQSYVAELALLEKEFRARISRREEMREELLEGDYFQEDPNQKLLDNTERLERSSRQLEGGYRMAVEAEQMGAQMLSDLNAQRETIKKAKLKVNETNYDLGWSSRIVNGMIKSIKQQKILLYAVAAIILLSVIFGIYLSIYKHT